MESEGFSSNWKKLQSTLRPDADKLSSNQRKRKSEPHIPSSTLDFQIHSLQKKQRTITRSPEQRSQKLSVGRMGSVKSKDSSVANGVRSVIEKDQVNAGLSSTAEIGRYVALDCEMVGVGPDPNNDSALARVSIVNYDGDQIYDSFVKPLEFVTDWRTQVSGISPKNMLHARSLEQVQSDVSNIIQDKIVIGHSIRNDFDALLLSHPRRDIRDTARHPPYRKLAGGGSPRLKLLASEILGLEIQVGEHSSVDDARACMLLFRRDKALFEREQAKKWPSRSTEVHTNTDTGNKSLSKPKKTKKKKR